MIASLPHPYVPRTEPASVTLELTDRVSVADQNRQHFFLRSETGILLVNARYHIIFADQRARTILNGHEGNARSPASSRSQRRAQPPPKLPAQVRQFLSALKRRLKGPLAQHGSEPACANTIVLINREHFTVRAYIMPCGRRRTLICFLLLFEKRAVRSGKPLEQGCSYYRLSLREVELIQLLAGGLTNKEISHRMRLSEWTVKEYLQNIMKKVHAATRSAVVAKVLSAGMKIILPLQLFSEVLDYLSLY